MQPAKIIQRSVIIHPTKDEECSFVDLRKVKGVLELSSNRFFTKKFLLVRHDLTGIEVREYETSLAFSNDDLHLKEIHEGYYLSLW